MTFMSEQQSNYHACLAVFLAALLLATFSLPALPDDSANPDKSDYSLFDPTPDDQMRSFSTDRPPKADSPYTVDAGHFQYEADLAVYGYGNTNGTTTRDWTVLDPTFKVGLTNTIDAELQITPYESMTTKTSAGRVSISGVGDEIFTSQYFESQDSPVYTLDEALACALTPNLQLDFGGNFGLNKPTPRNQVYAGLSQRF